jgi:pimeloyl-ACP methyl ester carboxylesterase
VTKNAALKSVNIDSTEFHYLEQGAGDPVLFVHGTLGDYRSWRQQMGPFAERYRVISISRRYHYPGTWNGGRSDYSAERQGEDIGRVIEELRLGRTHIVASSFGAFISLFTASNHPGLVRSLVLGEPPAFPILTAVPNGRSYWNDFDRRAWTPARNAFNRGDDEVAVQYFMDGVLGPGSYDKLSHSARKMLIDNVPALKAEVSSADYMSDISCELLRRIQIPTLLVGGELSPELFHRITDEFERCLPNRERITVPNASHAIHNQNARFYNRAVLDFLDRH